MAATQPSLERLNEYANIITGGTEGDMEWAVTCVRRLLSLERDPPITTVIEAGVVNPLVAMLDKSTPDTLLYEAAWALTNIASGNSEQTAVVVNAGAVPQFVELLDNANSAVVEQATWALGNIAGDCTRFRDLVIDNDAVGKLSEVMGRATQLSLLRNATWTMSNLMRGKPQPAISKVAAGAPVLARLLHHSDADIVNDALWGFAHLSDGTNDRITVVLETGVAPRLVELLMHPRSSCVQAALRAVGNIVTGDDSQTQVLLNCGAMPVVARLLTNSRRAICKEACWTVSNVTAGTSSQIQVVIDAGIIPILVNIARTGSFEVAKEALWALSNATEGGTREQLLLLVEHGVLAAMARYLSASQPRLITVALEGVRNLGRRLPRDVFTEAMEEHLSLLEDLQTHEQHDIYQLAVSIIEENFNAEDDGEAGPEAGPEALPEAVPEAVPGATEGTTESTDATEGATDALAGLTISNNDEETELATAVDDDGGDNNNNDEEDDGGGDFVF